jgi:DNA-binding transcriptional regulator YdaS (Cro superfamily)
MRRELADNLGVHPYTLSLIARRKRNAGAKIIMMIEQVTGGLIKPEDIRR